MNRKAYFILGSLSVLLLGAVSAGYVPSFDRVADLGKFLRVTSTGLSFGAATIDGATGVSGIVGVTNGGTAAANAPSGFKNLSPQTTKGDLVVYSTLPIRLAVGSTGQILNVDSTAASGIAWTTDKLGVSTNGSAAAGYVGEIITLSRTRTAAVNLSNTNVVCNVGAATCPSTGGTQSIALGQGDWLVGGYVGFSPAGTTSVSAFDFGISATSATSPGVDTTALPSSTTGEYRHMVYQAANVPTNSVSFAIAPYTVRVGAGSTTTLYLVAFATFTVSTCAVFGSLTARRIR